jgi:acyl dehydratase
MGTPTHSIDTVTLQFDSAPLNWRTLPLALLRKAPASGTLLPMPAFAAHWLGARAHAPSLRSYLELCEDHNPSAGVCVPPAPAPYYTFTLPPLFIHAMAMPLHLAILTHPRFPLPLLGLVHLANRTEVLEPVAPTEALDFACRLEELTYSPKGTGFTLHTEASTQGRVVWREQSTYLYPQRNASVSPRARQHSLTPMGEEIAQWDVAANAGRRFAVPVRDFNPIHISDFSARLLGQRSAIAHGLYSAARCLDRLRQERPVSTPFVLDVAFKRPLPLPSRVALWALDDKGGRRFTLQVRPADPAAERQIHLQGSLMPLGRKR